MNRKREHDKSCADGVVAREWRRYRVYSSHYKINMMVYSHLVHVQTTPIHTVSMGS